MKCAFPLLGTVAFIAFAVPAVYATQANTRDTSSSAIGKRHTQSQQAVTSQQSAGERIFQRNCARCHSAPEGFSPRISGTIVRHMRIRANLSEQDERELLRFFNP